MLNIGDLSTLQVSGSKNILYGIPEEEGGPTVFIWSCVGPGLPVEAFHSRWINLGYIPYNIVTSELREVIENKEERILEILSSYEGTYWSGNNYIGRWPEDLEVENLLEVEELPKFWDASDWYSSVSINEVIESYEDSENLDNIVEKEVNYSYDAYLDWDDVKDYLETNASIPTVEQLEKLKMEATEQGDLEQVSLCNIALNGGFPALHKCGKVIFL